MWPAILLLSCTVAVVSAGGATTAAGVPLPAGWTLRRSDIFGKHGNITNFTQLHAKYCEGEFYNVDSRCLVRLPNVMINNEQGTYEHFEKTVVFFNDHLQIQGRGRPDGVIQTAKMVAKYRPRNFCIEARYQIPATPGSWPAFYFYGSTDRNTASEIDVEQPVTLNGSQGVYDVSLNNHPTQGTIAIANPRFTTQWMTYHSAIDLSAAPHYYTVCYNDIRLPSQNGLTALSYTRPPIGNGLVRTRIPSLLWLLVGVGPEISRTRAHTSEILTSIRSNIMAHDASGPSVCAAGRKLVDMVNFTSPGLIELRSGA